MKNSAERLEWALKRCELSQVRMTPARSAILALLAAQRTPVNLDSILKVKGVGDRFDGTTVYRTLMLCKDAGLVRVVGTPGKTTYYVLSVPEDGSHFIVCDGCGAIVELQVPPNIQAAIRKLGIKHGFSGEHEHLEMQGLCNQCAGLVKAATTTSKVMARHCPARLQNHSKN